MMRQWLKKRWQSYLLQLARVLIVSWRWSCSRSTVRDPRAQCKALGQRYVYALLHEHQLAAVVANDEQRMAAMVSRSRDGDVLAAALQVTGVVAVRGSSQRDARNKGGQEALAQLVERVKAGEPALIAVDGPRGPRGQVRKGIVALARATDALILPVAVTASRGFRVKTTWDRPLVPAPFSRVTLVFGAPMQAPNEKRHDKVVCDELSQRLLQLAAHPS